MNYKDTKMKLNPDQSRQQTSIKIWLFFSCFIDLFGASLIIPVFGTHLRSLGFGHTWVGVLGSVYSGTQFISGPIVGSWGDSHGRRPTLCAILFTCSVCYLLLGVATSFYAILLIRVLLGCVKHTQTICKTLVADAVAPSEQAKTQARLSACASLGFTVGPVIAGHVSEMENGFLYLCAFTSFLFCVNGLTVFCFFPDCEHPINRKLLEQKNNSARSRRKFKRKTMIESEDVSEISTKSLNVCKLESSVFRILKDLTCVEWSKFWDVFAFKFILSTSLSLFFNNYYLFAQTMYGISSKHIGYLISVQSLTAALFGTSIAHFHGLYNNSTPYSRKILHCFIVFTVSLCGILTAPGVLMYYISVIILNGCTALLRTLTTELLLDRTSPEHRGSLMGAGNSINSCARFVSPLVAGFIQDRYGTSQVVVVSTSVAFLGTILSLTMGSYEQKSKSE
ncbi:major facilitator superfamily domain-containing protein 9 isoform X1 [Nilaparvata lugens]|uniref:major facilitator superfamily domain-containing protein 9 isoform X1 n=1 Tax=Nilaparvata lugens TaxID=108931 RepID=UPI00193C9467|nr:major facilitator superfamily domain-containing protein 9 isoform X1 [Nilaparvata lugens]